jgi:hypothetical protein
MSEAATIAPIVLCSNRCQGNLYLAGKNTFLEFYTDEDKAFKRSAWARSASADSHFKASERSTATTGISGLSSPSKCSISTAQSSDNEVVPNVENQTSNDDLQTPDTTPRANNIHDHETTPRANNNQTQHNIYLYQDESQYFMGTMSPSSNWDANRDVGASTGYRMMKIMMPMRAIPISIHESQQVQEPQVIKPCNKKSEAAAGHEKARLAKRRDLKKLNKASAVTAKCITTLMIRGIPCSMSQEALISLIDEAGLKNLYNFFYLPRDGNRSSNRSSNLGYAFINFVDQQSAELCTATLQGVPLAPTRSMKTCTISPADIQGLSSLWKHFRCTAVNRDSRRPMFLKV